MGLTLSGRYISLFLAVQIAYFLQAVGAAGKCDTVFKGFSDCLLQLGDNMAHYPQELEEKDNLHTICTYWDDFHSCATTALADCQDGAIELWEKLKKESKSLQFRGSLFELCAGGNGAPRAGPPLSLSLLLPALCALITGLSAL
ncbi:neuritin [Astyanax mexicanus]|uniref:Neuritin 1a n=1 Tax=Astyanax mexicanus TaxID=7994 RepID=A0A3B1JZC7_ASTMX|nr:neuritin [Astyanax mexicanus]